MKVKKGDLLFFPGDDICTIWEIEYEVRAGFSKKLMGYTCIAKIGPVLQEFIQLDHLKECIEDGRVIVFRTRREKKFLKLLLEDL